MHVGSGVQGDTTIPDDFGTCIALWKGYDLLNFVKLQSSTV